MFILCSSVAPAINPFSFGTSSIFAGQSLQLTCFVVDGDLPLQISWSFHHKNSSENFLQSSNLGIRTMEAGPKTSLLFIDSVTAEHQGIYTCTAKNPARLVNFSTTLNVNGTLISFAA